MFVVDVVFVMFAVCHTKGGQAVSEPVGVSGEVPGVGLVAWDFDSGRVTRGIDSAPLHFPTIVGDPQDVADRRQRLLPRERLCERSKMADNFRERNVLVVYVSVVGKETRSQAGRD